MHNSSSMQDGMGSDAMHFIESRQRRTLVVSSSERFCMAGYGAHRVHLPHSAAKTQRVHWVGHSANSASSCALIALVLS